jgi:hypothetical protein
VVPPVIAGDLQVASLPESASVLPATPVVQFGRIDPIIQPDTSAVPVINGSRIDCVAPVVAPAQILNSEILAHSVPGAGDSGCAPVGPSSSLDGLAQLVDDLAFQVWSCQRCLSFGHKTLSCTNQIRCRSCFRYGHIKKECLNKSRAGFMKWVPKSQGTAPVTPQVLPDIGLALEVSSPLSSASGCGLDLDSVSLQPPPAAMATFEFDPAPWVLIRLKRIYNF